MKARTPYLISFALALFLAIPAVQAVSVSESEARPGGILGQSRESGKRQHKQKRKKDENESSSNDRQRRGTAQGDARPTGETRPATRTTNSQPTTRRTTRTTTTSRQATPQGNAQPTGRTRPTNSQTTTRTTTRTRTTQTRHVRRAPRTRVSSTTTVHHHHHHDRPQDTYREPARSAAPSPDGFLTLGVGIGGFAAHQITDTALPGTHLNIGIGAKGRFWGMELGFNGGGYKFDPDSRGIDLSIMGVSGDLKLQPSIGFFEPYALVGLGGYLFQDGIMQETALGGALRLGLGADLRFDSVGIGARYLYSMYGFSNQAGLYEGLSAQTESVGLNVSFYF